ncbi:MAG: hypothetical protein R3F29_11020 [Planctomycetota bacterium]
MNDHLTRERDPFAARVGLGLRELDGLEQAPDVREAVRRRLAGAGRSLPETPRRRPVLLLLAALLALAVTATLMWQSRGGGAAGQEAGQTQDPQATQLVYRTAEAPTAAQRDALLEALQKRLGDFGTAACEGRTVTIGVPDPANAQRVRELVEGHRLEIRAVAYDDYKADAGVLGGEVRFDLAAERARLQAWLDAGGAARLREDPRAIEQFSAASKWLRWYPRLLRPDPRAPERWNYSLTMVPPLEDSVVTAYHTEDWNGGTVPQALLEQPAGQRFLVELLAINMHEVHFTEVDFDPQGVAVGKGHDGEPALHYAMRDDQRQAYGDLSERCVGKCLANLWDGEVLMAPIVQSRIPGVGSIQGMPPDAVELSARIFGNALPLPLEFVR